MVMALVSAFQAVLPQLLPLLLHALQLPHTRLWSFSGRTFIWLLLYMFSLASFCPTSCISACVCVFGQVSRSVFGPAGVLASCELPNGHYIKHENCSACWQFSSFSLCALRVVYCFVYVLSQFGFISVFVFTLSIASCPPIHLYLCLNLARMSKEIFASQIER